MAVAQHQVVHGEHVNPEDFRVMEENLIAPAEVEEYSPQCASVADLDIKGETLLPEQAGHPARHGVTHHVPRRQEDIDVVIYKNGNVNAISHGSFSPALRRLSL